MAWWAHGALLLTRAQDILDALPVTINPAGDEKKMWFWVAIGVSILAGIILLITLLCISRIRIAVACIKVGRGCVLRLAGPCAMAVGPTRPTL